jgi:hypothetical protein
VSARTGCGMAPGESTRETVAIDTPAARATSAIVATTVNLRSQTGEHGIDYRQRDEIWSRTADHGDG